MIIDEAVLLNATSHTHEAAIRAVALWVIVMRQCQIVVMSDECLPACKFSRLVFVSHHNVAL